MSTKRVFDDMYLYLKQANVTQDQVNLDTNGLPVQTYLEITSQYWNLIYKNSAHENANHNGNSARGKSLNVKDIEAEFDLNLEDNHFDFSNSFKHNPVVKRVASRKHQRNRTVTHGVQSKPGGPDRISVFNEIADRKKLESQSKFRSFNNNTTIDSKSVQENDFTSVNSRFGR